MLNNRQRVVIKRNLIIMKSKYIERLFVIGTISLIIYLSFNRVDSKTMWTNEFVIVAMLHYILWGYYSIRILKIKKQ